MWSWWDCMQWWNSVGDGTVPWLMFLPMMLWPIAVIGGIAALVMLLIRNGRTETQPNWRPDSGDSRHLKSSANALRAERSTGKSTRSARASCLSGSSSTLAHYPILLAAAFKPSWCRSG
jgi:hypothetical protein